MTAALIVAAVAFLGVRLGVAQKWRSDRREHWWSRTQWALEQLSLGEERRIIELLVLASQLTSSIAADDDRALVFGIASMVRDGDGS
jgi:hypothetical protein